MGWKFRGNSPASMTLTPELLGTLDAFSELDEHQLLLLASQLRIETCQQGQRLIEVGDIDSVEYFLLDGEVELISEDGVRRAMSAKDSAAKRPLARLRPRQYSIVVKKTAQVLKVEADVIEGLKEELLAQRKSSDNYGIAEVESVEQLELMELQVSFKEAVHTNQCVLPTLPEVALKVRQLLDEDDVSAEALAEVVNRDPAIAAKLIRAANSPIYHGSSNCDTTSQAIVRVGLLTTRQLVMSFAMHDLFAAETETLQQTMKQAWQDSVEMAAIALVLARRIKVSGYSAEEIMLAALLHNVGVIAVIGFVEGRPELQTHEKFASVLEVLQGVASELVLQRWKFPAGFIEVAKHYKNWQRDSQRGFDLCDLVQIACIHYRVRHKQVKDLPSLDTIPAITKLPQGALGPEMTIRILEEAREQIDSALNMLRA